jgi:hypothetical protein
MDWNPIPASHSFPFEQSVEIPDLGFLRIVEGKHTPINEVYSVSKIVYHPYYLIILINEHMWIYEYIYLRYLYVYMYKRICIYIHT